jgi:DNA-binding transcriptional LysR family regulator
MLFDFRLQVFHTVAARLSFTKAAEELFITQPAITKHIHVLEQQYQTKLFERRGNSIRLTESGKVLQRFTNQLQGVYNELEQEMNALNDNDKGTLFIGASTTIAQYVLPPLLASFHRQYPQARVMLTTGNTEAIEQALLRQDLNLGIIEGHTKNKQIKYTAYQKDEIVLTARKDHPLATKKQITIADLQTYPLLMREQGSGTLEIINLALKKAGLKINDINIEMQLDSTEAIKTYLQHSDCLSFISLQALQQELAQKTLFVLPIKDLKIERPYNLIHLHGEPNRLTNLFLKFALHYNLK